MNQLTEAAVTIFVAIIGVAILSVLVSPKANTVGVIRSVASGFGNDLGVAISPVTGNNYNIDLSCLLAYFVGALVGRTLG